MCVWMQLAMQGSTAWGCSCLRWDPVPSFHQSSRQINSVVKQKPSYGVSNRV